MKEEGRGEYAVRVTRKDRNDELPNLGAIKQQPNGFSF